jgi:TPR repeat protein
MSACLCEAVNASQASEIPPLSGNALKPLRGHTTHGFLKWPRSKGDIRGARCAEFAPVVDKDLHPVGTDRAKHEDDDRRNISDRFVLCLLANGYRWEGVDAISEQAASTPGGLRDPGASDPAAFSPAVIEGITACRAGDDERAFAVMLEAAEQGDSEAQFRVGVAYRRGRGVGSVALSVLWLQRAVGQGHVFAGSQLGELYLLGRGLDRSPERAEPLIRRAADDGYRRAQNTLGFMYEYGAGVPIDYSAAVQWYRRSAEQGDMNGRYNLGRLYYDGLGVTRNRSEAFRWLAQAAEQGQKHALQKVVVMLRDGEGTPKDLLRAYSYCEAAAEAAGPTTSQGKEYAYWRNQIAMGVSEEDLRRSSQLAAEIKGRIEAANARDDVCQSPELEQRRW